MSVLVWIVAGWLAAASIFVFGAIWGSRPVRDLEDHIARQDEDITALKAAQHHAGCLQVIDRLNSYATHLEGQLAGDDLDDELQRLLDSGGGGS